MTDAACSDQQSLHNPDGAATEALLDGTAIVILTWNQCDTTRRCLQSLERSGYSQSQVVLWDNGSVDQTEELIPIEFPDIVYHHHANNLGVASGRNAAALLAIRKLSPARLFFMDNDMVATTGLLEALCLPFESNPRLAQTLAKVRVLNEPERLQSAGGLRVNFSHATKSAIGYGEIDRGQFDVKRSCLPCGGAMVVSKSVFLQLDGFDSVFDPYGPEDLDFSCRVRSAGYDALYVPEAVLYHDYEFDVDVKTIGASHFSTRMRHWMILMQRHASLSERVGFYVWGAPLGVLRIAWREIGRGNFSALMGIPRGLRNYRRYLRGMKKKQRSPSDISIETD